jgi:hypothetical protein
MDDINKIRSKGIKLIIWALPCLFIGPVILHFALINQLQPLFWVIFGLGCLVCLSGIVFLFLGLKIFVKSLFGY